MVSEAFLLFLMSLSADPIAASNFKADPDSVLANVSLSDGEKALLKSGDARALQQAIAGPDESLGFSEQSKFVRPW